MSININNGIYNSGAMGFQSPGYGFQPNPQLRMLRMMMRSLLSQMRCGQGLARPQGGFGQKACCNPAQTHQSFTGQSCSKSKNTSNTNVNVNITNNNTTIINNNASTAVKVNGDNNDSMNLKNEAECSEGHSGHSGQCNESSESSGQSSGEKGGGQSESCSETKG